MSTPAQAVVDASPEPPTPAALPPEQQPPAQPLTPEQQQIEDIRRATSLLAGKIIDRDKPAEEDKKPETPPKQPEAKAPAQTPEQKPKTVRKPKPPEVSPALSPEQIAQLAATTAIEVTKRQEATAPELEDESKLELAEEFAPNRPYYEWMQRENPRKYGKLIRSIADWGPKEMDYIQRWEQENPGTTYDPDSEEHDEFYKQNQPKIDAKDLEAAKTRVGEVQEALKEDKIRQKILDEISPELNEIRMRKVQEKAAPRIQSAAVSAFEGILAGMNPEYAKYATDKAKLDEISESDPIAADIGQALAGRYVPLATEIAAFHAGVPFDKNNQAHVAMYYRTIDLERRISEQPIHNQIHEGRRFATQEQYSRMNKEQQAQHWIVGEQDLLYDLAAEARQTAAALYKQESDKMARYTKKKGVAPATNGRHEQAARPAPSSPRTSAPSVIPGPAVTPTPSGDSGHAKTGLDRFHERLVGNS